MNDKFAQKFIPSGPKDGKINIYNPSVRVSDNQTIENYRNGNVSQMEIEDLKKLFIKEIPPPKIVRAEPPPKKKKNSKKKSKPKPPPPKKEEPPPDMVKYQPIHLITRASVRYLQDNHDYAVIAITPHYIFVCEHQNHKDPNSPLIHVCNIHVMEVKKFYQGSNFQRIPFLLVRLFSRYYKKEKYQIKFTITCKDVIYLARILYRNVTLAYSTAYEYGPPLETETPSNFPMPFNVKLSPAQCFQFTYSSLCSYDSIPYNHEVVRYFHYQIVNHNGVFNAGYLPLDFSDDSSMPILNEMIPIFRALIHVKYIFGVVCDHVYRPEIFKAVSFQLYKSQNVHFLHLSHCGATKGLKDIHESLRNNLDAKISYFDFSGNVFDDLKNLGENNSSQPPNNKGAAKGSFFDIFSIYRTTIDYLSFNHCKFKEGHLKALFSAMKTGQCLNELKYLHIAGSELTEGARSVLKEYLHNHKKFLKSLDIGDLPLGLKETNAVQNLIDMIDGQEMFESLYLYNNPISKACFDSLISFIDKTPTLSLLDISGTNLTADQVSRIVDSMSSRFGYRQLTLIANGLQVNGSGTLSVVKGFLNGQLDRWVKLSFNNNGMKLADLQILIPLFHQMCCLKELSLSDNFDFTMEKIEMELCNLLRIPSLKILRIAGSEERYLGPKGRPLLLAIALSYMIRKKIGGLSMDEKIPKMDEISGKALKLILPSLIELGPPDSPNFSEMIRAKVSRIMAPFLIEKMKNKTRQELENISNPDQIREILNQLMPLIKRIGSSIRCENSNDDKKRRIGSYTMDILQRWADANVKEQLKDTSQFVESFIESKLIKGWIEMAANLAPLQELDISYNKIELSGIQAVTELLKIDKELRGVEIDGCNMSTITSIVNFVDVVCEQNHLTKMSFPVNDMQKLMKNAKSSAKKIVEHILRTQQIRMIKTIDRNRAEAGEFAELPFEPIPEIKKLIQDQTENMEKWLPVNSLRTHCGICEDFKRQLVYLPEDKDGFLKLPDDYRVEDIGEMEKYEQLLNADKAIFDSAFNQQSKPNTKKNDKNDKNNANNMDETIDKVENDDERKPVKLKLIKSTALTKFYDEFEYEIIPSQLVALNKMNKGRREEEEEPEKKEEKQELVKKEKIMSDSEDLEESELSLESEEDVENISLSKINDLFSVPAPRSTIKFTTTTTSEYKDTSESSATDDDDDDDKMAPEFDNSGAFLERPDLYTRKPVDIEDDNEEDNNENYTDFTTNFGELHSKLNLSLSSTKRLKFQKMEETAPPPID